MWANALEPLVYEAVDKTLAAISSDFDKTVKTWTKVPDFAVETAHVEGNDLIGRVTTDNEIYGYVNFGTEPHDIFPVNAKALKFASGYRAKTTPNVIGSKAGGASGSPVYAMGVHHPGTDARNFDKEIARRRQKTIQANVTAAVLKGTKAV
jgi:hypothetical protein